LREESIESRIRVHIAVFKSRIDLRLGAVNNLLQTLHQLPRRRGNPRRGRRRHFATHPPSFKRGKRRDAKASLFSFIYRNEVAMGRNQFSSFPLSLSLSLSILVLVSVPIPRRPKVQNPSPIKRRFLLYKGGGGRKEKNKIKKEIYLFIFINRCACVELCVYSGFWSGRHSAETQREREKS
jgi:hypothetical protein